MFFRDNGGWKLHKIECNHRGAVCKGSVFRCASRAIGLPATSLRATVSGQGLSGLSFKLTECDSGMQLPTIELDQDWMINNLYCNDHEQLLVEKIKQGDQVHIVSDGPFHPGMKIGTSAWVINSSSDHRHHLLENNLSLGAREAQFSHTSELSGMIGALAHWIRIGKM